MLMQNVQHMSARNTIQFIPLDNLIFDKDNPRLPNSINKTEESILEWMLNKENIIELMNSIGEKGFFPGEPILIVPPQDKKEDEKFIVIEGNRRYTASLLLSYPEKAPIKKTSVSEVSLQATHRPEELPALVFNSREEILDYLGYRHITGVEAWDALAKARYLSQLYDRLANNLTERDKYRTLAKQIGSTTQYVRQLLIGKRIYDVIESNHFFDVPGLDDRTFEFGTFYTAIVRPNIAKYVGIDIEDENPLENINNSHLRDLTEWMFFKNSENQTRLGESRNLGKLNKILDPKYESALIAFKEKSTPLSVAVDLTDEADEIFLRRISDAKDSIDLAWSYFPKILDYSSIDKEDLRAISKTVKLIYDNLIEKQINNSDLPTL